MRIVFMGTPEFAVEPLKALIREGYEIAGVFTQPDRPKGRGMKLVAPPVKAAALTHGIPVYQPETFRDHAAKPILDEVKPDCIVVAAYEEAHGRSPQASATPPLPSPESGASFGD